MNRLFNWKSHVIIHWKNLISRKLVSNPLLYYVASTEEIGGMLQILKDFHNSTTPLWSRILDDDNLYSIVK